MDRKLYEIGDEVNDYIVKAQAALASYNFYEGNKAGMAKQDDINKLRDLLRDAEYISRLLTHNAMIEGVA